MALAVVPLVLLAVLEMALRVTGYGYRTDFFLPWKVDGKKVFVENEKFSWRFFPRRLARRPLPLSFSAEKPADTFRIFTFGESAAMGDPQPAYSFSRILEVLLRERFPGIQFEVINVAFTAINSHVILPIARECSRQNADLWIVYMGNNEVMGPFGAGTIFSAQSPPLPIIRASLALKTLRTGQVVDHTLDQLFSSNSQTQTWVGMEMFLKQQIRLDDVQLKRVHEHFRRNLADILDLGIRSGAKVIVSTVASNLKDCAPLASLHASELNDSRISEFKKFYQGAGILEQAGQLTKAIDGYLAAERIDSTYAELQFRLANCYQAFTNQAEAQRRYALARDLDTLRFRADSRLNEMIKKAGARRAEQGVYLLDATDVLARNSTNGIPGDECFFDHVHLNFEGNYRLARAIAEKSLPVLPARISKNDTRTWASAELCGRRLAMTEWNSYLMYESMHHRLSTAPFTNQLNHRTRQQRYFFKLGELRPALQHAALGQAVAIYTEALSRSPNDPVLRENFAKLLHARGDLDAALRQFQRLIEFWPHYTAVHYNIGSVLNTQGKTSDAARYFEQALRLNPDYAEAHNGLGSVSMNQGKTRQAVQLFSKAIQLEPSLWEAHLNLALALEKLGDSSGAITGYTEALRLHPNSFSAHSRLGNLLAERGEIMTAMRHYSDAAKAQPEAALTEFKEFIRLHPEDPLAHFKLANALAALDRRGEAMERLRHAVQLKTNFWEARYLLGVELATQGKIREAQEQFSEVVRLRADFALAHLNLGVALAKQSLFSNAATHFHETLRLQPTNHLAKQYLQTIQSMTNAPRRL